MNVDIVRKRLTSLRKSKKLTQFEISEKIGLNRSSYSHYEIKSDQRLPENEILIRLAEFHNVSIDYIFGRTDIPELNSISHEIELSSAQLNHYHFTVDGEVVRKDELDLFVSLVRAQRMNRL